jgi:hypothetical protein
MSSVIQFREFPEAYPHYAEDRLDAQRKIAKELLQSSKRQAGRAINRKIEDSLLYFDLAALKSRGVSPSKANLRSLRSGFFDLNTQIYKEKGEGSRGGIHTDTDSRFFGMSRAEAREILMDELFPERSATEGAEVPTDDTGSGGASVASEGLSPIFAIGAVLVTAGLGYGVYYLATRENP